MDRTHPDSGDYVIPTLMTLRDYFAAQVLAVFAKDYVHDNSDVIADQAYTLADAMLKARSSDGRD